MKIETHLKEKVNSAIERNKAREHLWETRENCDARKMREYCKAHDIVGTHGGKAQYIPVNRGKYNINYWRTHEDRRDHTNIWKNKIVLVYYKNKGILKLARQVKQLEKNIYNIEIPIGSEIERIQGRRKSTLELPDKITIDKEVYNTPEMRETLIKNKVEVFELL